MTDLFGTALSDFFFHKKKFPLYASTSISAADRISMKYLLRDNLQMPALERDALARCCGRILDLGCGGGSHSLYLQEKGENVVACDRSEHMVRVATARGVLQTHLGTATDFPNSSFDTILILMNGSGLAGTLENLPLFLQQVAQKLTPGGQILLDSSDLAYMFADEEDAESILNGESYYGELDYHLSYRGARESFKWLYVDFETLRQKAETVGLIAERVFEGKHFDYLAKIYWANC
ncbi:class I SAM-dependent methyltransferase [Flavobacterium aurantiibacter]|nr:class I SAM-dependent methyltransferase [Flavobacterium aurantiibacter]